MKKILTIIGNSVTVLTSRRRDDIIKRYRGEIKTLRSFYPSFCFLIKKEVTSMKTGKKLLSVLLSVLMILGTVSISFSVFAAPAVSGKSAPLSATVWQASAPSRFTTRRAAFSARSGTASAKAKPACGCRSKPAR